MLEWIDAAVLFMNRLGMTLLLGVLAVGILGGGAWLGYKFFKELNNDE